MNRIDLRNQLAALDLTQRPSELSARQRMLELLDTTPECFFRHSFPGHFTGSALVMSADGQRALLHHHRKLDRWLQFGGHCDGEEDVLHVAQREAWEESGIDGLAVASSVPLDLDIHPIPENPARGEPGHLHYDVRYLFVAPKNAQFKMSDESKALRWFTPEEMLALPVDSGFRRLVTKWVKTTGR